MAAAVAGAVVAAAAGFGVGEHNPLFKIPRQTAAETSAPPGAACAADVAAGEAPCTAAPDVNVQMPLFKIPKQTEAASPTPPVARGTRFSGVKFVRSATADGMIKPRPPGVEESCVNRDVVTVVACMTVDAGAMDMTTDVVDAPVTVTMVDDMTTEVASAG